MPWFYPNSNPNKNTEKKQSPHEAKIEIQKKAELIEILEIMTLFY